MLWCAFIALWWHPMFWPLNIIELSSLTIIIYLDGKYAAFYHTIDLVCGATNVQKPTYNVAAYKQTPFNRATTYHNLIPTSNFQLEWVHQLVHNSYIHIDLVRFLLKDTEVGFVFVQTVSYFLWDALYRAWTWLCMFWVKLLREW